jgi:hypothetical protein
MPTSWPRAWWGMGRCALPRMGRDAVPSVTSPSTFVFLVVGDPNSKPRETSVLDISNITYFLHGFDPNRRRGVSLSHGSASRQHGDNQDVGCVAWPLSNAQEGESLVLVSESDIAVDNRFREFGRIYLTGLQALARLRVDSRRADLRANFNTAGFISGYQGSPLAGYDLELGRQSEPLEAHDIVLRPANEELAATSVQGTQLASASSWSRIMGVNERGGYRGHATRARAGIHSAIPEKT